VAVHHLGLACNMPSMLIDIELCIRLSDNHVGCSMYGDTCMFLTFAVVLDFCSACCLWFGMCTICWGCWSSVSGVLNHALLPWFVLERGSRGGGGGGARRAADASPMTPSDDEFDGNETMSMVSNCSDMQTVAQLTDGESSGFIA